MFVPGKFSRLILIFSVEVAAEVQTLGLPGPNALGYHATLLLWIIYIGDVLPDVTCDRLGIITPYLLTLANRNDPICVAAPKVAKASTVSCSCV